MEKETYNQSTAYPKFELISKLFNLAIAVAVVYEKYISCLGSFCPTTQGVGGGGCGATEISDFSRAAERRKKHYCPHPPSLPLLPSIVSEQCPRWYQLHLSTKWIRGQRQSAKSAISKALKKHTRLGIREQERALQFVHRHWSKQPQSCTDGQCGGKAGHLDFKSIAQEIQKSAQL